MAVGQPLIHAFNGGEVSTAALARVDIDKLRLAAETQENILPFVIGKGQVRPGTQYIGDTASDAKARLIPFVFSASDAALLELTDSLLRVWVSDALVTRASVISSVTNGDFNSSTGWTQSALHGGSITIGSGALTMSNPCVGANCTVYRSCSTSNVGTEHALRIVVGRGKVVFRVGSSAGAQDFISEQTLGVGTHSITFTPTAATYYVWFYSDIEVQVIVTSIAVESAGVMTLPTPFALADLPNIRFDQSGDIVFLACDGHQQIKVERRNTTAWSVVSYFSDDGPFSTTRTAKVKLTPGAIRGNTTLTADRDFFTANHVGALFKLHHTGQNMTFAFATDNVWSDVFAVPAVDTAAHKVNTTITGTFTATWQLQSSFDGEFEGFGKKDQGTGTQPLTSYDANATYKTWWRFGIPAGNYTSGEVDVVFQTDSGGGTGICRVTSFVSSTQVNIEVLKHFKDTTATDIWYEGMWSNAQIWPTAVCFFDGRLWWGGEDNIWGSVSDNFYSFDVDTIGDSGPILREVATGAVNQIKALLPLSRMVLLTEGAEVSARSSSLDEPLTPSAFTLKDASTLGSASVSPVKVDQRGIYIQRSGVRVYALEFQGVYAVVDYSSTDLTRINADITGTGISELSVQRAPDPYVWMVRNDGVLLLLLYAPDEQVVCWTKVLVGGDTATVESVCVLPGTSEDAVYVSVKRTINGSTVRYIEKFATHANAVGGTNNYMADSFVTAAGPTSSVLAAHLKNATGIVAWGTANGVTGPISTSLTADASGNVALGGTYTNVTVGFGYTAKYKSAKLAYAAQGGTALLQSKKVRNIGLLAENITPGGVTYGKDFNNLDPLPSDDFATSVVSAYDMPTFPFVGIWDSDARVCLQVRAPYSATFLGLVIDIETNELL